MKYLLLLVIACGALAKPIKHDENDHDKLEDVERMIRAVMSWDSYIDNLLGHGGGHTDQACIIGKDGSKWTTDGHPKALKITSAEAATIGKIFTSGDFTPLQASGILLSGIKYQFLRGEENVVLGKKKDHGAITLQASKTAIVIGHTAEGASQGNTNKAVGVIADYLESIGM